MGAHWQVEQLTAENARLRMAQKALVADAHVLSNSRRGTHSKCHLLMHSNNGAPTPPGLLPSQPPPGLMLPQQVPAALNAQALRQRKAEFDSLSEGSTCSGDECSDVSDA